MGREIKRVPLDFDWPIEQTWLAYAVHVEFPPCPTCDRTGYSEPARQIKTDLRSGAIPWPDGLGRFDEYRAINTIVEQRGVDPLCFRCEGHGNLGTEELRAWADDMPSTPLPVGEAWQLWETVGDSPMSPVFADSADLVQWMTENPWMLNPSLGGPSLVPATREVAERFVAAGWAPSFITTSTNGVTTLTDGVSWAAGSHP